MDNQAETHEINLNFVIETYQRERVIPLLPILYQWSQAFQRPPYSFAGFHEDDIIDSQDFMYVNEKKSLVVVARIKESIVGVGAGLSFDSRYAIDYFEKTQENLFKTVSDKGFDVSKIFYIPFILTAPEYKKTPLLAQLIFEKFCEFALKLGNTEVCYMTDLTYSSVDPLETWMRYINGFKKMGVILKRFWLTKQENGTFKKQEHLLELFIKTI